MDDNEIINEANKEYLNNADGKAWTRWISALIRLAREDERKDKQVKP